jgi:signal transduction histidine kinase
MPRALEDLGLAPALHDMLQKALARPGMHHSFEHFGLEQRLAPEMEVGVYRIAQELVGNIIKHASAREVHVQLLRNKGHLVLIVEDDGKGMDLTLRSNGLGMRSITDRARMLRGTVEFESSPGQGTVATLRIPLSPTDHRP